MVISGETCAVCCLGILQLLVLSRQLSSESSWRCSSPGLWETRRTFSCKRGSSCFQFLDCRESLSCVQWIIPGEHPGSVEEENAWCECRRYKSDERGEIRIRQDRSIVRVGLQRDRRGRSYSWWRNGAGGLQERWLGSRGDGEGGSKRRWVGKGDGSLNSDTF